MSNDDDSPLPVAPAPRRLGIKLAINNRARTLGASVGGATNRAAQLGIGNGATNRAARLGIGTGLAARAARLGLTPDDDGDQEQSA